MEQPVPEATPITDDYVERGDALPMFHWAPQRITAHVKPCVLALLIQRTAELRSGESWARLQDRLRTLKAVRHTSEGRAIVRTTRLADDLRELLTKLGVPAPKPVLAVA